jgi:NADH-quinone oxidoreductase subunit M
MYPTFRVLVLLLVLLPLASAVIVPLFGRFARRVALISALLHMGVTAAVALGTLEELSVRNERAAGTRWLGIPRFEPTFVPGDPGHGGDRTIGTGRTHWTLLNLSADPGPEDRPGPRIQFFLGVDGLNLWLVALCSLMMLPAILVSWEAVRDRPGGFYGWLFLLQTGAVGAFLSFDVILFYVFFELTLIPAFFLIGRWGAGSARRDAARKFFLYTLAGSLLTLVGVIGIVLTNPDDKGRITFSLPDLMANVQVVMTKAFRASLAGNPAELAAKHGVQFWLFVALIAGFMVKVPVWPFHTWLPSAYNEAPIGVTVTLSALLAKLGTFGILRFVLPLTPDAAITYGLPAIGTLAAFGIVYGALCAYAQRDMKLLIAYSSLSHLGFLVLGLFAFNTEGISGATLHMVNHGISTGALFALMGFFLDRYRTTDMRQFGGLMGRFPRFAFLTFVLCLASIGLPGLNNFVSEMLMLAGLFDARNPGIHRLGLAVVAAFSILLSAWYILTMLQRVFFNPLREPPAAGTEAPKDLSQRELFAYGTLATVCLALGLFPQVIVGSMKADVAVLSEIGDNARVRITGILPQPPTPATPPVIPKGAPKGGGKGPNPKGKGGAKVTPPQE